MYVTSPLYCTTAAFLSHSYLRKASAHILCSYHQTTYSVGTGGGFPEGGLRPVNEADHSPISSTEVKNEWSLTYTSLYAFIAMQGL
jgi:hypothetical protein